MFLLLTSLSSASLLNFTDALADNNPRTEEPVATAPIQLGAILIAGLADSTPSQEYESDADIALNGKFAAQLGDDKKPNYDSEADVALNGKFAAKLGDSKKTPVEDLLAMLDDSLFSSLAEGLVDDVEVMLVNHKGNKTRIHVKKQVLPGKKGKYNITIEPSAGKKLKFSDVTPEDIQEVKFEEFRREGKYSNSVAIDLSGLNFTNATYTAVARRTGLYKCKEWNYTEQNCYGEWVKIQVLTPGQQYSVDLYPEDPALSEGDGFFFDGFEGGLENWTINGTGAVWELSTANPYNGSQHAHSIQPGNNRPTTMRINVSTAGFPGIMVSYARQLIGIDNSDEFTASWFNGTHWKILETTGSSSADDAAYVVQNFTLTKDAENNPLFALAFTCEANAGGEECRIDDINVWDDPPANVSTCTTIVQNAVLINNITSNLSSDTDQCININGDNVYLDCQGFSITGNGSGRAIEVINNFNVTIRNCVLQNFNDNIFFGGVNDSIIFNNTILNAADDNLDLQDTNYSIIDLNNVSGSFDNNIVFIRGVANNITRNIVENAAGDAQAQGLALFTDSRQNRVANNTFLNNQDEGIRATGPDNLIINNTVIGSGDDNIEVTAQNTIVQNRLFNSTDDGIAVTVVDLVNISDNLVVNSGNDGIFLQDSNFTIIHNNNISDSFDNNIILLRAFFTNITENIIESASGAATSQGLAVFNSSDFSFVANNTVLNNQDEGIRATSNNNTIIDNIIQGNNDDGIEIFQAEGNIIRFNTITLSNDDGVVLSAANFTLIENNTLINNSNDGIFLTSGSNRNILRANVIRDNVANFSDGISILSNIDDQEDNLVEDNIIINMGDDGIQFINRSFRAVVRNNTISDTGMVTVLGDGILFVGVMTGNISGNNLTNLGNRGMRVSRSANITVEHNRITNVSDRFINIFLTNDTTLINNTLVEGRPTEFILENTENSVIDDTDIGNYSFTNASVEIKKTGKGRLKFKNKATGKGRNLSQVVIIEQDVIFVNATAAPEFNQSSNLTYFDFNATTAELIVGVDFDDDGSYVDCPASICTVVENDQSTEQVILNVTQFSKYHLDRAKVHVRDNSQLPALLFLNGTPELRTNTTAAITRIVDATAANLTMPNGTVVEIVLVNQSRDIYNHTLSLDEFVLRGQHNISFLGNDTTGLTNATVTITFNRVPFDIIDVVNDTNAQHELSTVVDSNTSGLLNLTISINRSHVNTLRVIRHSDTSTGSRIAITNATPTTKFVSRYVIDTKDFNFTEVIATSTADGTSVFECNWNTSSQSCIDTPVKVKKVSRSQDYNLSITKRNRSAFVETNNTVDIVTRDFRLLEFNETRIVNPDGTANVTQNIGGQPIELIEIKNVNESVANDLRIDEVPVVDPEFEEHVQQYAIDTGSLNFTTANITITAKGNKLRKCSQWNITTRTCEGFWETIRSDLVPGQNYTIEITPGDPGFQEINATDAWRTDGTDDRHVIENIFDAIAQNDGNFSVPIRRHEFARAQFITNLTSGNIIDFVAKANKTGDVFIEIYPLNSTQLLATTGFLLETPVHFFVSLNMSENDTFDTFDMRTMSASGDNTAAIEYDFIHDQGPPTRGTIFEVTPGENVISGTGDTFATGKTVNPDVSMLIFNTRHNSNAPNGGQITGQILNSTHLDFQRSSSASGTQPVFWYVAEFDSGVRVYRGRDQVGGGGENTYAIGAVLENLSQSFIVPGGYRQVGTTWGNDDHARFRIVNTTHIGLQGVGATAAGDDSDWQVVVFNGSFVQRDLITMPVGIATMDINLSTAVITNRSFAMISYDSSANTLDNGNIRATLVSSTQLQLNRSGTGSAHEISWEVVELPVPSLDGNFVQHNVATMANGVSTANVAITPIALNRSVAFSAAGPHGGLSIGEFNNASDDIPGRGMATHNITNTTNLLLTRDATDADAIFSWFVVEFEQPIVQQNVSAITVTKTDDPEPVNTSTNLTYQINVSSTGAETAFNVTVNDTYPPQVIFLAASPTPLSGTNNTFILGNMTPGATIAVNITVLVTNVSNNTIINNTANVTFNNITGALLSEFATESTIVIAPPIVVQPGALDVFLGTPIQNITTNITQNTTFVVSANISCSTGSCGNVTIFARHNTTFTTEFGTASDGAITVTAANTVVNNYTFTTANVSAGATTISVDDNLSLSAGDEIFIIQMQNGTVFGRAGNYEFRNVQSVAGTTITLSQGLANSYFAGAVNTSNSTVTQVVRVPHYSTVTINSGASIVAPAWDGQTGGIVVFRANSTVNVSGSINVTERGFRGGFGGIDGPGNLSESYDGRAGTGGADCATLDCAEGIGTLGGGAGRFNQGGNNTAGLRGGGGSGGYEAGADTTNSGGGGGGGGYGGGGGGGGGSGDGADVSGNGGSGGRTGTSAGGGGGASGNTFGGTGGNAGSAGSGGNGVGGAAGSGAATGFGGGAANDVDTGGSGGGGGGLYGDIQLNGIFLGSGGGAGGDSNEANETDGRDGAAGGGLVLIVARTLDVSGSIRAVGGEGLAGGSATQPAGASGGGSGGTIFLRSQTMLIGTNLVNASGGNGGATGTGSASGPGGGDGGVGRIRLDANTISGATDPLPGLNGTAPSSFTEGFVAISTTNGDVPLFTTSANPQFCILAAGEFCQINWTVNATGNITQQMVINVNATSNDTAVNTALSGNGTVQIVSPVAVVPSVLNTSVLAPPLDIINQKLQNSTFTFNVTVSCIGGTESCSAVSLAARYNASGLDPDTNISSLFNATPFYIVESIRSNDVVVALQSTTNELRIYKFNNGQWEETTNVSDQPGGIEALEVGDADNDGLNEIVVGVDSDNQAKIFDYNITDGSWTETDISGNYDWHIEDIAIGDADNDGLNEVVVGLERTGTGQPTTGVTPVRMLKLVGSTWTETNITGDDETNAVQWVEIGNVDGVPGNEVVALYANVTSDSGHMSKVEAYQNGSPWRRINVTPLMGGADARAERMDIGDVDNDGADEIVASTWNDVGAAPIFRMFIAENTTGPDWEQINITIDNGLIDGIDIGDLNADGRIDIAVTNDLVVSAAGPNYVAVYENISGFTMTNVSGTSSGLGRDANIGDANNDGRIDLIAAQDQPLNLYENVTGTQINTTIQTFSVDIDSADVADPDNDGRLNNISCGTLQVNASCQINYTIKVTGDIGTIWSIDINATSSDSRSNDSQNATIEIIGPVVALANFSDVSVIKTDSPDPVDVNVNLTYQINVTSNGTGTAFNVTVNDTYPSLVIFQSASPTPLSGTNNTFILGNMTNGTTISINVTVFTTNASNGTFINNTVNVTFNNATGILRQQDDEEATTLRSQIKLNITLDGPFAGTTTKIGQNFTFVITANISCDDTTGTCGNVTAFALRNITNANIFGNISTVNGATPLFTTSPQPQHCILDVGEFCQINWTVNASGTINETVIIAVNASSNESGIIDGVSGNATIRIVRANLAPVAENVTLNTTSINNLTSDNLTLHFNVYDDDADAIVNITNFFVNNRTLSTLYLPFEPHGSDEQVLVKDYSSFLRNGTVNSAVFNTSSSLNGQGAYEFNGINSSINNISNQSINPQEGTIIVWANPKQIFQSGSQQHVVWVGDPTGNGYGGQQELHLGLRHFNESHNLTGFTFWYGDAEVNDDVGQLIPGPNYTFVGSGNLTDDRWYHVAVSWDLNVGITRLYLNGTLFTEDNNTNETYHTDNWQGTINIGKPGANTRFFNGTLDEIRIYDRALSSNQIMAFYLNSSRVIVSNETQTGEVWFGCVTPNDGFVDGNRTCSNNVTILAANLAPEAENVTLNATSPNNVTLDNLTLHFGAFDVDGNSVQNVTNFFVNNRSITVLNMPFENNEQVTGVAKDYSPMRNNGTVVGALFNASGGHDGFGAYHFDDITDYIQINTTGFGLTNMTYMARVNLRSFIASEMYIFGHTTLPAFVNRIQLYEVDSQLRVGLGNTHNLAQGSNLTTNEWHHVALVLNGSNFTVYLDGTVDMQGNFSGLTTLGGLMDIGNDGDPATRIEAWNGTIDDVRIYNRTLTPEQINATFRNLTNTIVSQETRTGEIWYGCVTPNDGRVDGNETCSNNLTIAAAAPACPQVFTTSQTLSSNITCPANAVIMNASNIFLDCSGRTITYGTAGGNNNFGVGVSARSNVTIRNCIIRDSNASGTFSNAINLTRTNNSYVLSNTIFTNGTSSNFGVLLRQQNNRNTIANNTIRTQGTAANNYGIFVITTSGNNNVTGNVIFTNGTSANQGVRIDASANNNVTNNTIRTRGTTFNNHGVHVQASTATNNQVSRNTIITNGTSDNNGVNIITNAATTSVIANTIITGGTSNFNVGVHINSTSTRHNVTNNIINTTGISNNIGIRIERANLSRFVNNTIMSAGSNFSHAILLNNASGTLVDNSTLFTSGTQSYGVVLIGTGATTFNRILFNNTVQWINTSVTTLPANFTNTTFEMPDGSINILPQVQINESVAITKARLNTTFNLSFVNDRNLSFFNVSSIVRLRNVNVSSPQIRVDYDDDGTFENCPSNICTVLETTATDVTFNVTQWSSYAIAETPPCPRVFTTSQTLSGDITCPDTAVIMNASDIELDCAGFSISYNTDGGASEFGVLADGRSGVTVRNCVIQDVNSTGAGSAGINFTLSNNSVIRENTIFGNSTSGFDGISGIWLTSDINNVTVRNNTFNLDSGSGSSKRGITVSDIRASTFSENTISTDNGFNNDGFFVSSPCEFNIVENNTITTNGTFSNNGISINSCDSNNVSQNAIVVAGTTLNDGIQIVSGSNFNRIDGNFINATGSGIENNAILIETSSGDNVIQNNILQLNGSSQSAGIDTSNSNDLRIFNNTIISDGTGQANRGMVVNGTSRANLSDNIINTTGLSENTGVRIELSNDTLLFGNTIRTSGGNASHGMEFINATRNTAASNTVRTNGTSRNYGIELLNGANDNTLSNNTIITGGSSDNNYGILVNDTNRVNISDNRINTTGVNENYGIRVEDSDNNLFFGDVITTRGEDNSVGLLFTTDSSNNTVQQSTITIAANETSNHGVFINGGFDNRIIGSTITSNGSTDSKCIEIQGLGSTHTHTLIENNTLLSGASSGGTHHCIRLEGASGNSIVNNNIRTLSIAATTGIVIETNSVNNSVYLNSITGANGDLNDGISVADFTRGNNITQNIIHVGGGATGNNDAIIISNSNFTTVQHNIITSAVEGITIQGGSAFNNFTNNTVNLSAIGGFGISATSQLGNNLFTANKIHTISNTSTGIILNTNGTFFDQTLLNNTFFWINFTADTANNITNTTFAMPDGQINVLPQIQINGSQNLNRTVINITTNNAFLDSVELPFFNTSSIIDLNSITFANPIPIVDFNNDGSFTNCPLEICDVLSFTNNLFVFNVTQFTSYRAHEVVSLFNLSPFTNQVVQLNDTVNITANATGGIGIDFVTANVTLPNGTVLNINLENVTRTIFNYSWLNLTQRGQYNITFFTNDTFSIFNVTESTFFIRQSKNLVDIRLRRTEFANDSFVLANYSTINLSNISNVLNLSVSLNGSRVSTINITAHFEDSFGSILDIDDWQPRTGSSTLFAINPEVLNFTNATVTINATGQVLRKCDNWNVDEQNCDGSFVTVQNIEPGQNYVVLLNATDPGFSESSPAVDVALAPVSNETFVLAFIRNDTNTLEFRYLDTDGTLIANATVDATVDTDSRVSVAPINSTHIAVSWVDGPSDIIRRQIFNLTAGNTTGVLNVATGVGLFTDVSVSQIGDRFGICNANDGNGDAEFRAYNNTNAAEIVSTVQVDSAMRPEATLQNLVECAGVNSTRNVFAWFDDQGPNTMVYSILDETGSIIVDRQIIDNTPGDVAQVATTAIDNNKFAVLWYDVQEQDITLTVRHIDNTELLAPTDIDALAGTESRVALTTLRNDSSLLDFFVAVWFNQSESAIKAAVFNGTGSIITAPFTVDSTPNTAFRLIDVTAKEPMTNNSICPGKFIVAFSNNTDQGIFRGYDIDGTEWDGNCAVGQPDLRLNATSIFFNNTFPRENENISVNVTICNVGTAAATNFNVTFKDGNETGGVEISNETINSLPAGSCVVANDTYISVIGNRTICAVADAPLPTGVITESNESNNVGCTQLNVQQYSFFFGQLNGNLTLGDADNDLEYSWNHTDGGKLYFFDADSAFNFSALQALGRNTTNGTAENDFEEATIALNMTVFNESITLLWAVDNSTPRRLANISVFNRLIEGVPIINSTNTSFFVTGILWDTQDDVGNDGQFDIADSEDLVFVVNISQNQAGGLGDSIDYEARIPSLLRSYKSSADVISFITELN